MVFFHFLEIYFHVFYVFFYWRPIFTEDFFFFQLGLFWIQTKAEWNSILNDHFARFITEYFIGLRLYAYDICKMTIFETKILVFRSLCIHERPKLHISYHRRQLSLLKVLNFLFIIWIIFLKILHLILTSFYAGNNFIYFIFLEFSFLISFQLRQSKLLNIIFSFYQLKIICFVYFQK